MGWEFLLCCQSEAIPLCAGTPDDATGLSAERHSGVWVTGNRTLCLKLQRRKNRPQGSLLQRPCVCALRTAQFCAACRVKALLRVRTPHERLWQLSADCVLKQLRRFLTLLGQPRPEAFTLKAFRAGKATALAASGKSLGVILAAGEWRSSAVLAYVNENVVDRAQILDATLVASEDEADQAV